MRFLSIQGLLDYEAARKLQHDLVSLRARDQIEDTVLFLEHEPVITQGKGLQWVGVPRPKHMPLPDVPEGVAFASTERGGDLTYHGPGQLVVYPIFKLDGKGIGPERDVIGFLRNFEAVFVNTLARLKLKGGTRPDATGVWVGEHKIASIGIAVRRWVTYHGMAINVVNDLKPFQHFSPCGFSPNVMTRLKDLVDVPSEWRTWLEEQVAAEFLELDRVETEQKRVEVERLSWDAIRNRTPEVSSESSVEVRPTEPEKPQLS